MINLVSLVKGESWAEGVHRKIRGYIETFSTEFGLNSGKLLLHTEIDQIMFQTICVLCCVVSCHAVSCRVASRRGVSCRVMTCRVVSLRVVSCATAHIINTSYVFLRTQCCGTRVQKIWSWRTDTSQTGFSGACIFILSSYFCTTFTQ